MKKKFEEFVNDGKSSIKGKLSEFTYNDIAEFLGSNHFNMHYNSSDALRHINCETSFSDVVESLIKSYGDVNIVVTRGVYWFDEVKIDDAVWEKDYNDFCKAKQAWCDKYGCD